VRRTLILAFLAALAPALRASSGGRYSLSISQQGGGGGSDLSGGSFRAQGALGEAFLPASEAFVLRGRRFQVRDGFYNPPKFGLQNALGFTLSDPTGSVFVSLPPYAVASPTFEVAIRSNPLDRPLRADPGMIREANQKLSFNSPLSQVLPTHLWEIDVVDEEGFHGQALAGQGAISFRYRDMRGDGIVDGTNPPVRAKTLKPWILDEARALWVQLPDSSVDLGGRRVTAPLRHFSVFAFIGGLDTSVADAYAFPVPFRPHGPQAGSGPGQTGTLAAGITFTNLPSEGTIEIYTLAGQLAGKIEIPPNLAPATLAWDVRNSAGEPVASGVYLWRVVSHGNAKTDRLMIIR